MQATPMAATTFFTLPSPNSVESRVSSTHASSGCGKFDGVAMWFINGVTAAFFASLNRCSCIRIATHEDPEDANVLPLMLNDGNLRHGEGKKGEAVLVHQDSK